MVLARPKLSLPIGLTGPILVHLSGADLILAVAVPASIAAAYYFAASHLRSRPKWSRAAAVIFASGVLTAAMAWRVDTPEVSYWLFGALLAFQAMVLTALVPATAILTMPLRRPPRAISPIEPFAFYLHEETRAPWDHCCATASNASDINFLRLNMLFIPALLLMPAPVLLPIYAAWTIAIYREIFYGPAPQAVVRQAQPAIGRA